MMLSDILIEVLYKIEIIFCCDFLSDFIINMEELRFNFIMNVLRFISSIKMIICSFIFYFVKMLTYID